MTDVEILSPAYPCHPERTVTFRADAAKSPEVLARTCPVCGRRWRVTRTTRQARFDVVEWALDVPVRGVSAPLVFMDEHGVAHTVERVPEVEVVSMWRASETIEEARSVASWIVLRVRS